MAATGQNPFPCPPYCSTDDPLNTPAMTIPWYLAWTAYGATAAAFGGFAVGLWRWRQLGRGQKLVTAWLGVSILSDLASYVAAGVWQNTQPVLQLWLVASVILGLETLAAFQHNRRMVVLFRCMGAAYFVAWLVLAWVVESVARYSTFAAPLQGVVLLGAAVATILRRASLGRRDLAGDAGFLVAIAIRGNGHHRGVPDGRGATHVAAQRRTGQQLLHVEQRGQHPGGTPDPHRHPAAGGPGTGARVMSDSHAQLALTVLITTFVVIAALLVIVLVSSTIRQQRRYPPHPRTLWRPPPQRAR